MNSKKKTRTIKELSATNSELKKTVSGLRRQLTKTETKLTKANEKAERWKKETAAQRTAASRSDARVEKLQKKLDRAAAALEPVQAVGPLEAAASGRTVGEPTGADGPHRPRPDVDGGPAPGGGQSSETSSPTAGAHPLVLKAEDVTVSRVGQRYRRDEVAHTLIVSLAEPVDLDGLPTV